MKVQNRVKNHEEFSEIVHSSQVEKNGYFTCHYKKNDLTYTRIGISVSKRLGNAVHRNKVKRQIRQMVIELLSLTDPWNLIIVARAAYDINDFAKGKEQLQSLLQIIRRKLDDKKS